MKIQDTPRSGRCGTTVAFVSPFGQCVRTMCIPHNTITPARQRMRGIFGHNSQMWSAILTEAQQDRWNAAGPQVMSHPQLAARGPLTGQQFWQSISSVRGCVGLPPIYDPPAPVTFGPSPIGQVEITNDETGVRLWLPVLGDLNEDIMVFGQEPCPSGRRKRRNVVYLGLLTPPIGGRSELTHLYKARFGEPRPGRRIFIVTCQEREGWKAMDRVTHALVPNLPPTAPAALNLASLASPAPSTPSSSHPPHMHKGCPPPAQGYDRRPSSHAVAGNEPATGGGQAPGAASGGDGGGNGGPASG
jgi:hypothetical protein